jgi:3-oxoacyl-[acyl-carrier protein] reductase
LHEEMAMRTRFAGRVALVTGGASGIGWAVARQLGQEGAAVFVADVDDAAAGRAAETLGAGGIACGAFAVDIRDRARVEAMCDACIRTFGKIDILIHSAGIGIERPFLDTSVEEWQRVIDVDLTGTFHVCQAAARTMVANRYGRIVLLASAAALRGGTGRAAYGAAKGGVVTLAKVMAVELALFGVTTNALAPGAIETELVARMHSPETREAYTARIPAGRYGTPDETAAAAVFLASEEAGYVNGHTLAVDGGFAAAGVMGRRKSA